MIETRLKQIFDYLTLDYDYHTSNEIGEVMELSSKTIRKEINQLNSVIKDKGAIIESKPGKGYIFKIVDKDKFKNFLKSDWYKYAYYQQESGEKDIRYENILKMLLFSNSYIKQFELAEIFHISESQINKDLPYVKEILATYDLNLISKPYYGMKIEGSEKNIRLAIKNEIGEDPSLFDDDENKELFNKIQAIIDNIDFGEDYYMPYVNFKNLVIHIYISILRIRQKKFISLPKDMESKVTSYEEFKLANRIVNKLKDELKIDIPKQELVYITLHLIAKNTIKDQEKISTEILELSQKIIDEIYRISKYDFRANIDFYFSLAIHLGPLINRIKYGFDMKNPILDDIKDNKVPYLIATIAANTINERYETKLSEDETGYLALHIMAAINNNNLNKKKILIVCGSGNSSAQIMKAQLNSQFKNNIEEIDTTDLRSLENINIYNYDLVISSVNIENKCDIPVVYVDIIFSKSDLLNIENAFDYNENSEIEEIFKYSEFISSKNTHTKDMVFIEISKIIERKSKFNRTKAYEQLLERDKMGKTSINGIAIPHILDTVKGKSYLIAIKPRENINWNGDPVGLILTFVLGKDNYRLESFYEKLGNVLNNIINIKNVNKIMSLDDLMKYFIN